jgi:hypothetical protein
MGELRAPRDAELREAAMEVADDRAMRQVELVADVLVRQSHDDHLRDLALLRTQGVPGFRGPRRPTMTAWTKR